MELTKEHFDQVLKTLATKDDLDELASKDDLSKEIAPLKEQLTIEGKIDRLSVRTNEGHTATLKDVVKLKGRVKSLEREVEKLKLQHAA